MSLFVSSRRLMRTSTVAQVPTQYFQWKRLCFCRLNSSTLALSARLYSNFNCAKHYDQQQKQQRQRPNYQILLHISSGMITRSSMKRNDWNNASYSNIRTTTSKRRRKVYSKSNKNDSNNTTASHEYNGNGLEKPQIIYQNNHLLVVNKPPGWHSIPNSSCTSVTATNLSNDNHSTNINSNNKNEKKCLLSYLKQNLYGGGSNKTFLLPLHRLDQPCSGLLLFGKTKKAASRIQSVWNHAVQKTYIVVVDVTTAITSASTSSSTSSSTLSTTTSVNNSHSKLNNNHPVVEHLHQRSFPVTVASTESIEQQGLTSTNHPIDTNVSELRKNDTTAAKSVSSSFLRHNNNWMELRGYMVKNLNDCTSTTTKRNNNINKNNQRSNKGWSVKMIPFCANKHTGRVKTTRKNSCNNDNDKNKNSDSYSDSCTSETTDYNDMNKYRLCTLRWRISENHTTTILSSSSSQQQLQQFDIDDNKLDHEYRRRYIPLEIQTNEGSRHMIRSILSCHNVPIAGDVRYSLFSKNSNNSSSSSSSISRRMRRNQLTDMSVALHAHTITLSNEIQLGPKTTTTPTLTTITTTNHDPSCTTLTTENITFTGAATDNPNNNNTRSNIPTNVALQRTFHAPIPSTWKQYFGIVEK